MDAGADEVGEATTATGGGKTTRLVLHSRNRRLDPFRGVRVGEAANPGPETKGKGKGKLPGEPPELPDHYGTLGGRPTATPEEVKKAYRTLSLQHHPDKPGGNKARFQQLTAAKEMLSDPVRRGAYDEGRRRRLRCCRRGGRWRWRWR